MTVFFISDTHFGHQNIIRHANRPFKNVGEMDDVLIHNWNKTVGESDTVYHLGDVTLGNRDSFEHYASQLNGDIRILTNPSHHDKNWLRNNKPGDIIMAGDKEIMLLPAIYMVRYNETRIVICHFPLYEWEGMYRGYYHLFGHLHGSDQDAERKYKSMEVSVERIDYMPIRIDNAISRIQEPMDDYLV